MAYESDDICPPNVDVEALDVRALASADCKNSRTDEMQSIETEISDIRPDDGDLYPKQSPAQYLDIARSPDFKAGDKIDYEDGDTKSNDGNADSSASPLFVVITWFLVGSIALWLYFQLAGLIGVALECQGLRAWAAWILLAIPIFALTFAAIKFWFVFRRLPAREQVRGDLQTSDISQKKALANRLKPYLAELPENYEVVFDRDKQTDVKSRIKKLSSDILTISKTFRK